MNTRIQGIHGYSNQQISLSQLQAVNEMLHCGISANEKGIKREMVNGTE